MAFLPKPVESRPATGVDSAQVDRPDANRCAPPGAPRSFDSPRRRAQRDLKVRSTQSSLLHLEEGLSRVKEGLEGLGPSLDKAKGSMAALKASAGGSKAARRRICIALSELQQQSRELASALRVLGADL